MIWEHKTYSEYANRFKNKSMKENYFW